MLIKAKKRKAPQNLSRAQTPNINEVNNSAGLINNAMPAAPIESPQTIVQTIKEELSPEERQALVEQMQIELEQEKETLLQQFSQGIELEREKAMAEVNQKINEIQAKELELSDREFEINQFLENEKRILEEKTQAEWSKIQETEQQLKTQYEQAIQVAHEQGYQEGKQKLDLVSAEFENIINNIHRAKEELLNEIEPIITSLALDVARKILKRESRLDKQLITEQVKSSIKKVTVKSGLLEVSLNPADMEHEQDLEKALAKMLDKEVRLIFQENPAIDQGSCIVETRGGQLDSSFAIQIESIKLAFEKYLGREVELLEESPEEELLEQEIPEPEALALVPELTEEELETEQEAEALTQTEETIEEPEAVSNIEEIISEPELELQEKSESITEDETEMALPELEDIEDLDVPEFEIETEEEAAIKEEFGADITKEESEKLVEEPEATVTEEIPETIETDLTEEPEATVTEEIPETIETDLTEEPEATVTEEISETEETDLTEEPEATVTEEISETVETDLTEEPGFDEETVRLMNELDDDFNIDTSTKNETIETDIDLSEIDSELEEILSEVIEEKPETEETESFGEEIKNETTESEISEEEIKNITEEIEAKQEEKSTKDEEIKEHIEEMTLSDLEALFDNGDKEEETIDSDLDFILDQLNINNENTPNDLVELGSKYSNNDIEAESMDPLKNELDLNLEMDTPSEEDLLNIENNMDDLITEIENEDIDEIEAIMNSEQSNININLSKEDSEEEKAESEAEIILEISEDEILGNFDEESFDKEDLEEDDNVTNTEENNNSPSYSSNSNNSDPDEPEFESFYESTEDDDYDGYSDGYDPRFPEY